ncbi:MAG: 3-sulfinopropanoyl-CoA desulfinase [Pseudomonadota bacterium]
MTTLTPTQEQLKCRALEFADGFVRDRAAEVDLTEAYPWPTINALASAGFMGMTIPEAYGGPGLTYLDATLVIEEMAKACGVTGRIVVEANMGALGAVMAYGTEEQKQKVAALVLGGDKPAICITEPEAGSAATEMTTTATKVAGGYVLNGTKYWITGGGVSRTHLIFARIIDSGEDMGIGGFLAFREENDGLRVGERIQTMGLRGIPETYLHFDDMFIADAWALPLPGGPGRGFGKLMTAYNSQRVGAATVAHGIAQGAFELARDYLKSRCQFGRPLAEFQGLQWMLADMSVSLTASRALIHQAAQSDVNGFPAQDAAAQAKIFASEMAVKVTGDALQMHGAAGYARHNPLERMVRDARMFTIGGGTAQMLRNQVASAVLGMKLPQTRDGYTSVEDGPSRFQTAAE